jgi:hypothetical protein
MNSKMIGEAIYIRVSERKENPIATLDPIIPPFDCHFEIYKRDLAILTE